MKDLRRPLAINFLSSSGSIILQFIVSLLLARILNPHEIGIFSITLVFVNIAHIFRDFGVSTYLQREPNLTNDKIRSASGVMFASSWLIALVLFVSSEKLASLFGEPQMANVLRVLSIGFFFNPFGSITNALLSREFAADKQAYAAVTGTTAYCLTSLSLALFGFGAMSLAWANLVNVLVCAITLAPFRPKGIPWLPSYRNWKDIAHFGAGSLFASCTVAINNALPDILLGRMANANKVGLFSRANSTVSIFTYVAGSTVNYGSASYISQTYHRGESLTPLISRATCLLTGLGWPALALTAIFGKEIVIAFYGDKWLSCVPAILGLTATAAINMIFNYTPTAITALGRPVLSSIPMAITAVTRIACAIALFDGNLQTFSWIMFAATLATSPITIYQQNKYLKYKFMPMILAVAPSLVVSGICAVAGASLQILMGELLHPVYQLCIAFPPLCIVWYIALRITKHPLAKEVDTLTKKLATRLVKPKTESF